MKELLTCLILVTLVNKAYSVCSASNADVTTEIPKAVLATLSITDPQAAQTAYATLNKTCTGLDEKRVTWGCTWEELDGLLNISVAALAARPELQTVAHAFRNFKTLCEDHCYRPWLRSLAIKPDMDPANLYMTVRDETGYGSCKTTEIKETRPCIETEVPPCFKTSKVQSCTYAEGRYPEVANISYICHLPEVFFECAMEIISYWRTCKSDVDKKPFGDAVAYDRFTLGNVLAFKMSSCNDVLREDLSCGFVQSSSPEFKLCMSEALKDSNAVSDSDTKDEDLRCSRSSCVDQYVTECNMNEPQKNVSTYYKYAANIRNGHVFDNYCAACANIMASAYVIMASLLIFWTF